MPAHLKVTATDPARYSHGYNGTALKAILVRGFRPGQPLSADNIVARATGFSYTVATPVSQADEINSRYVKETNYGRQELGTGRIDEVFNLKANDELPTFQSLAQEEELTLLDVTGDDHEFTDINGVPTILNAFTGVRIVNQGSGSLVNQQRMLNVDIVFRQHFNGAEWKLQSGSSVNYPADVTEEPVV